MTFNVPRVRTLAWGWLAICVFCFVFETETLCIPDQPQTCCVVKVGLELLALLPLSPKSWDNVQPLIYFFTYEMVSLHSPGCLETHLLTGFKLTEILLPLSPECWDLSMHHHVWLIFIYFSVPQGFVHVRQMSCYPSS